MGGPAADVAVARAGTSGRAGGPPFPDAFAGATAAGLVTVPFRAAAPAPAGAVFDAAGSKIADRSSAPKMTVAGRSIHTYQGRLPRPPRPAEIGAPLVSDPPPDEPGALPPNNPPPDSVPDPPPSKLPPPAPNPLPGTPGSGPLPRRSSAAPARTGPPGS